MSRIHLIGDHFLTELPSAKKPNVGINCVAPGCRSKIGASQLVQFFKFPTERARFELWCSNAKRLDLALLDPEEISERFEVCSLHFEPSMFAPGCHDKLILDAVPTIFSNTDSDGVYPCTHCKINFISKTMQSSHEKFCRSKNKSKPLEVIANSMQIDAKDVLKMIPKTGSEKPKNYQCKSCTYATSSKTSFAKHQMVHMGVKPHKCSYCEYSCVQKGNLLRHEKIHTGDKPFECNYCGYRSSEKGHMKTHLLIHQGVKPYKCNLCDYACSLAGNLKRHQRSHTGEKNYECDICGYRCREACNLRDHLMVHSGDKPYQCGECGYRCTQASNMKTHMRIHTGLKPYVCSECGFKCTRAGNLKDHMKIHTGERPFSCPICDYRAAQSCHLKNHMKTHANEIV